MPRRNNSFADDLVLAPWWVSAVLALLAYAILPGVLPPAIGNSGLPGIVALLLLALSAISALRSLSTRRSLESQTGIDSLRELPWKRFEDLLGEAYRRQGYGVEESLGGGADGGVDLVLRKDGQVVLVQCKRWKGRPVPVQTVRELYGVMVDRCASAAKVVATTSFTAEAIAFATGKPIELIDHKRMTQLVRDVQTSARMNVAPERRSNDTASCPLCGTSMVLREAKRGRNAGGKFWGCHRYPACRGTRPM